MSGDPQASGSGTAAGGDKGPVTRVAAQTTAFEALETDFRNVLNELVGDKTLERFRIEYEKLHNTLKKSHDNEKKLIKKCRQLNSEIVANAAKIQTALRLSLQDQNSITLLKKEIDKAWSMVDSAQEKEKKARENVQRLKKQIANLTRLVDQGAGLSIGKENTVNELLKVKEELLLEVESQQQVIAESTSLIKSLEEQTVRLGDRQRQMDNEVEVLTKLNVQLKEESNQDVLRADALQQEMLAIKELNDKQKNDLQDKKGLYESAHGKWVATDQQRSLMSQQLEKYTQITAERKRQNEEYEQVLAEKNKEFQELTDEKKQLKDRLYRKGKDLEKFNRELVEQQKTMSKLEADRITFTAGRDEAEKYREWLKEEMKVILKHLEQQKKETETDEKVIRDLQQQVKRLSASQHVAHEKNTMQFKLVQDHESVKVALEDDILTHKLEEQKLRKRNYQLEKQREKSALNAAMWHAKYQEALESVKVREAKLTDLQKQVQDEKIKLKAQRTLYEQVRADRNLFSKQQVLSENEIADMKRKFKIMTHQIDQLKDEIDAKDHELINEHFAFTKLEGEKKVAKHKLSKRKEVLSTAYQVLDSQDAEIKNFRRTLMEAEAAQQQQKRICDDVVQERDILASQLIRRNDELKVLYEKIRVQMSTLQKGEIQYELKLDDIAQIRDDTKQLRKLLEIRSHEVTNIEALKNEVYHVQRELLQERTKVKALSEELENPMNVHRWRKLEGSDPKRFELIQKVQTLRKRLIQKTEEVDGKNRMLDEKEKAYVQLKNLLARQPGPEVAEQLSIYQGSLKEKTQQMKAMEAEIHVFQSQVTEYRMEIERILKELTGAKKRLYNTKRKEQMQATIARQDNLTNDPLVLQQQKFHATQPKITGGGFNLLAGKKRPQLVPQAF